MAANNNSASASNNIKMDPYAYDDQSQQQPQFSGNSSSVQQHGVSRLKRSMTLDLNSASRMPAFKRAKLGQQAVLSSPDLNMLKLPTPELERMIMQQHENSGNLNTPTPMLFPRSVTEEQELYARGFVDALEELRQENSRDSGQMGGSSGSNLAAESSGANFSSVTYTNLEPQHVQTVSSSLTSLPGISPGGGFRGSSCGSTSSGASSPVSGHYGSMSPGLVGVRIKDEPQTVPSIGGNSPPMSPIDMECQERIKLERKRQRNRVAASKCRRRKLERIARLEDKVKVLKGENTDLSTVVNRLKEQVCQLKEQVMDHVQSGCQIMAGTSPTTVAY